MIDVVKDWPSSAVIITLQESWDFLKILTLTNSITTRKKKNTTDEQIIVKAFGGPRKGWAVETKV